MTQTRPKYFFTNLAAGFIACLLLPAVSPAGTLLTPAEEEKLRYCEAGANELNPFIASNCLNERWIFERLSEKDAGRRLKFLRTANTLKDLLDLIDMHQDPRGLRIALASRLQAHAAELGIGRPPENFIS